MPLRTTPNVTRKKYPSPKAAYVPYVAVFEHTLAVNEGDVAQNEIIEIGVLPAGCRVHEAVLTTANMDTANAIDVGFVTGTPGDDETTRTMTADLFSGESANATATLNPAGASAIEPSVDHRGIGVRFTDAAETAQGDQTIQLIVTYYSL